MMLLIYWHLQYKTVFITWFHHQISYCTHNLIVLTEFTVDAFHYFAAFCHLLEIGISKVTGHPCSDESDDVVCVFI